MIKQLLINAIIVISYVSTVVALFVTADYMIKLSDLGGILYGGK